MGIPRRPRPFYLLRQRSLFGIVRVEERRREVEIESGQRLAGVESPGPDGPLVRRDVSRPEFERLFEGVPDPKELLVVAVILYGFEGNPGPVGQGPAFGVCEIRTDVGPEFGDAAVAVVGVGRHGAEGDT